MNADALRRESAKVDLIRLESELAAKAADSLHSSATGSTETGETEESILDNSRLLACLQRLEAHWPKPKIKTPELVFQKLGRFEIRRELGRGRFGVVFLAWDPQLQRQVALKVPQFDAAMDPDLRERFRGEALAAGKLQHSGIVSIYEVGQYAGVDYLAMAYVQGTTLAERLKAGPLPPADAARLCRQLAEAVHHAHEQGVIHRDLKPSNVLLDQQDQPRVTDFGLARRLSESAMRATATGQVLGTPAYMPPEQATGQSDIRAPSDVYSLGVILYETLTGRPPFQAAGFAEAVEFILNRDPLPPSKLNPKIPRELEAITLKCLEKTPLARYSTAAELAADLQRFLDGKPVYARSHGYVYYALRWARKYPSQALLLVATVVAIALLLTTGVVYTRWQHASELAAEQRATAETERYFSTVSRARNIIGRRHPGWSAAAQAELQTAAGSRSPAADRLELRALATECLTGFDVQAAGTLKTGMLVGRIAASPDGRMLAVGELKGSLVCRVMVYDALSRQPLHNFRIVNLASSLNRLKEGESKWQEGVREFAFTSDSRYLAVGMRFGSIYCYDLQSPDKPPQRLIVSKEREMARIGFSADGQTLLGTTKDDHFLRWRNWQTNPIEESHPDLAAASLAIASQGPGIFVQLITNRGFRMLSSDLQRRLHYSQLASLPAANEYDLVTDAAGRLLAGESEHGIRVYETGAGYLLRRLHDDTVANESVANELQMSADGQLLSAYDNDGIVRLFDVTRGRQVMRIDLPRHDFQDVALDPQRRWLAAANDDLIDFWSLSAVPIRQVVNSPSEQVEDMQFSRTGDALACLATAGGRVGPCRSSLLTFDTASGALIEQRDGGWERLGWGAPPGTLAWSATGAELVTSGAMGATRWQRSGAGELSSLGPLPLLSAQSPVQFQFSSQVQKQDLPPAIVEQHPHPHLAGQSVWNIIPNQQPVHIKARLSRPVNTEKQIPAAIVALRVDGDHSYQPLLKIHVALPGKPTTTQPAPAWVLSPAGDFNLWSFELPREVTDWSEFDMTIEADARVRSYQIERIDFATLTLAAPQGHAPLTQPIDFLAFSPRGDRLWGSVNEAVVSWSWPMVERLTHWENSNHQITRAANIRTLVVGKTGTLAGARNGRVYWLDPEKGTPQAVWTGPGKEVVAAALCEEASLALVGAENGKVRGLSLTDEETLFDLTADDSAILCLAATPDGETLVTASGNRGLKIWRRSNNATSGYDLYCQLPDTHSQLKKVALTPDGKYLALLSHSTASVELWNLSVLRSELARVGIE